jgi:nucleoside-diphosphate-sugar epimerase
MIVAVTGGAGFIGQRLVSKLLLLGHEVRVLTRIARDAKPGLEYFIGDLKHEFNNLDWLDGVEILFNCAGELADASSMEDLHIKGTERLAISASGKIKRWVQLSSTGAYGLKRAGIVTELEALAPRGQYEVTKAKADEIITSYSKKCSFESCILRPSIVLDRKCPINPFI